MDVLIDFTDMTLVSEDTYQRPNPDAPEEHDDPDDHESVFSQSVFSESVFLKGVFYEPVQCIFPKCIFRKCIS